MHLFREGSKTAIPVAIDGANAGLQMVAGDVPLGNHLHRLVFFEERADDPQRSYLIL